MIKKMKSEREKMLAGEPYDCADPELLTRWHRAKDLIRELSAADTRNKILIDRILTELLGSREQNLAIVPPFFCDYGNNIFIGNNTEINHNCVFLDCNTITIGCNVLIAPSVQLYTAFHPIKANERIIAPKEGDTQNGMNFCLTKSAPIVIGNNVWIGGGSIVLPGVTIGENAVIGAGSVVTHDIPADVVAYGNPCRIVRKIQ